MILMSSTSQIQRYEYSGDLNTISFVDISTLPFHAINMNVVSLFADLPFMFLTILNLYYINILFKFK